MSKEAAVAEETRKEPVIVPVEGGISSGQDVKLTSGSTEAVDFAGREARVIRSEEVRYNSESGKTEPMVMVRPYLRDGRLGTPFDMPRRRVRGPRDGGRIFGFFFGKRTGGGKKVVPLPFQNPFARKTPHRLPKELAGIDDAQEERAGNPAEET